MPTLIGPAIDLTLPAPAPVFVASYSLPTPITAAPTPGPGNPESPWSPPVVLEAPRVQVVLGEAITQNVLGELATADVEDWDDDVELLAGYTASIRASSTDPLWEVIATSSTIGVDGRPKYSFDPKGYVVWIYEDDLCVWTGRFGAPVDIGGGVVALPAQGPQSVLFNRFLGRVEQEDRLDDRGSFEGANPLAGWRVPVGVTASVVTDGVRGTKALRVIGEGWVGSPKIVLEGAAGYGRAVIGSTFGKWDITIPAGAVVVKTYTQKIGDTEPANELVTDEASGVRPDDDEGWTGAPVDSGARMKEGVDRHHNWVEVRSFDGVPSYYDLVTLRQSIQTGFPPGSERDLSLYVERIHRDLTARELGGSPTGLSVQVISPYTGTEVSMRWSHATRTPVSDVLSIVLDHEDGPECRVTPAWALEVHARLGTDRDDIALSALDVIDGKWTVDPDAQIDDFVVDTGRGEGATAVFATVSTPTVADRWRNAAIVQGPTDRTLNELGAWARSHARAAARLQVTSEVQVTRELADQITTGDSLMVYLEDGDLYDGRRMRVLRRRVQPKQGLVTLSLGAFDA